MSSEYIGLLEKDYLGGIGCCPLPEAIEEASASDERGLRSSGQGIVTDECFFWRGERWSAHILEVTLNYLWADVSIFPDERVVSYAVGLMNGFLSAHAWPLRSELELTFFSVGSIQPPTIISPSGALYVSPKCRRRQLGGTVKQRIVSNTLGKDFIRYQCIRSLTITSKINA